MAELGWMMLANYAEAPQGIGVVYIMGGAWDTLTVGAPVEGLPPGSNIVAPMSGFLVCRVLFHKTETGQDHRFEMTVMGEQEVAQVQATMRIEKTPGLPPGWLQGANLVVPLGGIGLPDFGVYSVSVSVDNKHLGETGFRVLKGY